MQELLGGQHAKGSNAFRTPRVPQAPKVLKTSTSTTQVFTPPVSATTSSTTSIVPAPVTPTAPTVSHAVPAVVAAAPAIPCAAVSDIAAKDPPGCINNWLGGLPPPNPRSRASSHERNCHLPQQERRWKQLKPRLGEFLPIMRDFNIKLDIGLSTEAPSAPPAPPPKVSQPETPVPNPEHVH
ncbi:hypothetical protein SERLADRAFT_442571 [Serpula lacrymans var. lacrymans S7.9]|uniref:Uncharacterized protein n=1 Tax=Serpula lacrymans var. lacrymans (strain S7.9) TaxID=578457 RepID=F8PAA4_SERL9|nr:uncharacterized protein SERLADRAFT_442571 [Serpula lacrymans var. lacrymans S7.9]EGO19744.1 hypothetical protein SERLADRAFT_442571 [Serpula lacrymans var. lacrymans S7.9]